MIGENWAPTESMRTLKYLSADATNHKSRLHQMDLIGEFLRDNVKQKVFLNWESIYGE